MKQVPKAIYDRVIARRIEEDVDEMHGSILISDAGKEKPIYGEVIATGEGDYSLGVLIPMKVKVGDKIIFPKIGPSRIFIGKTEYISMREREILAIVEDIETVSGE
jgi:chaperonin GroES